jgi:hypothetical protein
MTFRARGLSSGKAGSFAGAGVALGIALIFAFATAGEAAAKERYFAFEPDSDAARYRSLNITITVHVGLLSSTVLKIYRERGLDLSLERPGNTLSEGAVAKLLGRDTGDLRLYKVNEKDGSGFAHGACKGATRAWLAFRPIKPYEPLRIYVLTYDEATKGPALCETLDYRWHGEFELPHQTRDLSSGAEPGSHF